MYSGWITFILWSPSWHNYAFSLLSTLPLYALFTPQEIRTSHNGSLLGHKLFKGEDLGEVESFTPCTSNGYNRICLFVSHISVECLHNPLKFSFHSKLPILLLQFTAWILSWLDLKKKDGEASMVMKASPVYLFYPWLSEERFQLVAGLAASQFNFCLMTLTPALPPPGTCLHPGFSVLFLG